MVGENWGWYTELLDVDETEVTDWYECVVRALAVESLLDNVESSWESSK